MCGDLGSPSGYVEQATDREGGALRGSGDRNDPEVGPDTP